VFYPYIELILGEGEKHTILEICLKQVEDIMDCTEDLVECVNNDIKKEILGNLGKLTAWDKIDKITEADEETLQQEKSGCAFEKGEEDINKRKRKATIQVQPVNSKITKKNNLMLVHLEYEEVNLEKGSSQNQCDNSQAEGDVFDDWDWNSDEFDSEELKEDFDLHVNFYDDETIQADWNDFNFWKIEKPSVEVLLKMDIPNEKLTGKDYDNLCIDINKKDLIAWEDPEAIDLIMKYEENKRVDKLFTKHLGNKNNFFIISDDENEENYKTRETYVHSWLNEMNRKETKSKEDVNGNWMNWDFWEHFGSVEEITHSYETIFELKASEDFEDGIISIKNETGRKKRKFSEKEGLADGRSFIIKKKKKKNNSKLCYLDTFMIAPINQRKYCKQLCKTKSFNYVKTIRGKRKLLAKMFPKQPGTSFKNM